MQKVKLYFELETESEFKNALKIETNFLNIKI